MDEIWASKPPTLSKVSTLMRPTVQTEIIQRTSRTIPGSDHFIQTGGAQGENTNRNAAQSIPLGRSYGAETLKHFVNIFEP